jgi:hypothetical protein
MVLITIVMGVYKPTYNWGAQLCSIWMYLECHFSMRKTYWSLSNEALYTDSQYHQILKHHQSSTDVSYLPSPSREGVPPYQNKKGFLRPCELRLRPQPVWRCEIYPELKTKHFNRESNPCEKGIYQDIPLKTRHFNRELDFSSGSRFIPLRCQAFPQQAEDPLARALPLAKAPKDESPRVGWCEATGEKQLLQILRPSWCGKCFNGIQWWFNGDLMGFNGVLMGYMMVYPLVSLW